MKRKGQSALEFVILVSFMLVVFFIFFVGIQEKITQGVKAQDLQYLKEANNIVLSEVELARLADADFQHSFRLQEVNGNSYSISLGDEYEVVSNYGDQEFVNFFLVPVYGELYSNLSSYDTIYKLDGIVRFPNNTLEYHPEYEGIFMNVNPEVCYLKDSSSNCSSLSIPEQTLCNTWFSLC